MDERARLTEGVVDAGEIDRFLSKVIPELEVLPEHAEDWEAGGPGAIDEQDAYEPEWASVVGGRMDRLEAALGAGAMTPAQEARYARAKELFRQRVPLIERHGLARPAVPLGG